ncbi:hypothetical protein GCM10009133_21530 [Cocleimonas flava]|uniref:Uncharacterized protein n=1 Tax=Cocleimonas flava TaxID=634765 RepID=A0A4R1ESM6_9GAMM|nr:hypothetical protein [Cocleimonas flava]TCJ82689.1 hypothetical protein EV695_3421 [Cocleimonas flava]
MSNKELNVEVNCWVDEWFDQVEELIKKDHDISIIKVKSLHNHDNYSDDNDFFYVSFGVDYFPKGVYERLSKSKDVVEQKLFKDFWVWSALFAFDQLLSRYEQLEEVIFEYSYSSRNRLSIKRRKGDEPWLNLQSFICGSITINDAKKYIPFFLEDITTLTEYQFPQLKNQDITKVIVANNPNINTFSCRWDNVTKEILSMPFKDFLVDKKYRKKYEKLEDELKHLEDDEKYILLRLFLTEQNPSFKPKAETLLAFLNASLLNVRKRALETFHTYYSKDIDNFDRLTFCVTGTLQAYKLMQVKELMVESNAKIVTKLTSDTDVLVLGFKPKIKEMPKSITVISAITFEKLLSSLENRTLSENSNENIAGKLQDLLFSDDDSNVNIAFSLMKDGGIPTDVFALVCGLFKVHPTKKIRDEAKELIARHGGKIGKAFLELCAKRNYISMGNDEKPKRDLLALEKLEGFDVELFAYVLVAKKDIAKFYLLTKESIWAEKCIVDFVNTKSRGWIRVDGMASSYFRLATNIDNIYVKYYSDVFEKMPWLKSLSIENTKETIIIPKKSTSELSHLESLSITAKEIHIEGALSLDEISLIAQVVKVDGKIEAAKFLDITSKELVTEELNNNGEIHLTNIKKINDELFISGSPKKLEINNCTFDSETYSKFFTSSLEEIHIEDKRKFTLNECVQKLDAKSIIIEAKSINIEGTTGSLKSEYLKLITSALTCKKQWVHEVQSLEVVYNAPLDMMLNNIVEKLTLRYDFVDEFKNDASIDRLILDSLEKHPNIQSLSLIGDGASYSDIYFKTSIEIPSIKKLVLKDLTYHCEDVMPFSNIESLDLVDVEMDTNTQKKIMVDSLQRIYQDKYEGVFDFDVTNLPKLYELKLCMSRVKHAIYPIKKLNISHIKIENFKSENFPNVEVFKQAYKTDDFSDLEGFKQLRVLEVMADYNPKLIGIEKLEGLETLKLYEDYISYGKHKTSWFPPFEKPLKIAKLILQKTNLIIDNSSHNYFSNLEELVLDDALVRDFSVFKMPSLKRITILNLPSVNRPKNWLEDLEAMFDGVIMEKN